MKSAGVLAILFVVFSFNALADDSALSDNPYASVVDRNIFGLVPIPVNAPPETKPPDPPSKITPNGIMNLFGELQVLFKVSVPPKPGLPPHDQSYTMSVGERSDGIEVTKIDKQAGMITFDNHGVIQELSLSKAVASAAAQPAAASPGFRPSGFNGFRGRPNPNGNQSSGGNNYNSPVATAYGNNGANQAYGNNGAAQDYGSTPTAYGNNNLQSQTQNQQNQLTPEAQAILMEQSRIATQDQVNQGKMPPLPPTVITPVEATGVGGAPLVSAPPPIP